MITADDIRRIKEYVEFLEEFMTIRETRKEQEMCALYKDAIQNCEDQVRYNTAQAYRLLPGV